MTKAYLSKRAVADLRQTNLLKEGLQEMQRNQYSRNDNADGLISLGVAENKLMQEELLQKLPSLFELDYAHLQYGLPHGSVELRTHVAKLLNKYFDPKTPVHPDHITVTNGVSAAINGLSYAICDPGDAVLITAPYYGTFDSDVTVRSGARTITVNLEGRSPFDVDHVESLESAYQKAVADGINVRAMIICNPHNPLARCYSRAVIERLLRFASKHNLHAIFDEVYALSDFDHIIGDSKSDPFMSVLSLDNLASLIDPALVQVVYGISKDFCLNGFRVGFHISPWNPDVVNAMKAIAYVIKFCNDILIHILLSYFWVPRWVGKSWLDVEYEC
ncbi:pyridoxal phosphate-dependent transferase [Jimgerdemannia flammicorona]|uniref:Pyridoxal phosphate-dependent transferase n=1 Tax=Jimgerdemannia flammicorona TaxID=994334 RepID=A0A433QTR0_9FUNG|nr:pyridoxal phosphate-dependent transferase [Jimgerdemannia flammicorona]